jgi:hypothetical protein
MAEFYDEPMPVRVVDENFGDRSEVLFQDALPVRIVNPEDEGEDGGGGGGDYTLPARLAEHAQPINASDVPLNNLRTTGWYAGTGYVLPDRSAGDLLIQVIASDDEAIQIVQELSSYQKTLRRRVYSGGSWSAWTSIIDDGSGVDSYAREQMVYSDRYFLTDEYVSGQYNLGSSMGKSGVVRVYLSDDSVIDEFYQWGSYDSAIEVTVIIYQDETGGHSITWPESIKWAGGIAPEFSLAPNSVEIIKFLGTSTEWIGYSVGPSYIA